MTFGVLPFIYKQDKGWVPQPDFDFTNVKGAGDIAASTTDLLKFNQLLFTGKIVNQDLLKFMKPATTKDRFGHGLMLMPFYYVYFYGHGGDTKGTHCLMAYNDNDSISIALNLNGQRTSRNDIFIGILSILYDRAYDFPNYKTLKTDPLALKQYE